MNDIINSISGIQVYIILGLAVIVIILFVLICTVFGSISKLKKRYKTMMHGTNGKSIEKLINDYFNKMDTIENSINKVEQNNNDVSKALNKCIQKVSAIRYKAFEDVGSDLSFSIALLDNANNGVVLTGIYGREESTTYAKPIDKGISRYDLSDEEKQVLNDAMSK